MEDNLDNVVIMEEEEIYDMAPMDVRNHFEGKQTEKDLADAFAFVSNKFFWIEDNVYNYEEDTAKFASICAIIDEWEALMDEYEERIFSILISEGVTIPENARIKVLKPFMARNGYVDCDGWWIEAGKIKRD